MAPSPIRPLHWVFKIGDRTATVAFLQDLMGMQVLRHEEFKEGCQAACNGPYDGMWSKTMIGFGDEDTHFVLELTYNYDIKQYQLGNDLRSITVRSTSAYKRLGDKKLGSPLQAVGTGQASSLSVAAASPSAVQVQAPDGYSFVVIDDDTGGDPVTEVALNVQDLQASLRYWHALLGCAVEEQTETTAVLSATTGGCKLRLVQLPAGQRIDHGTAMLGEKVRGRGAAYSCKALAMMEVVQKLQQFMWLRFGRIAFSCPGGQLQQLEDDVKGRGYTVLTPFVSLDTPGKATVQVVILADPDGHEICFVGDEGFRELSRRDEAGPQLLADAIRDDKSAEWEEKRKRMERMAAQAGA